MSHLDPGIQFETLKKNILPAIQGLFPIVGRKHTLTVDNLRIEDDKHVMDFATQKEARLKGRTWAVPLYGDATLTDTTTGKVVDKVKGLRLVSLPKITHRFSFIIGGKEYQTLTQFLRRPGVYAQVAQNGVLTAQFNLARKGGAENFDVAFDPVTRLFTMKYRNSDSHIKLYPVLKAMGVHDKEIEDAWGPEILKSNLVANPSTEYRKLSRIMGKPYTTDEAIIQSLQETMAGTALDPETTHITLGKSFEKVEGETVLLSSAKLLGISRNEVPVDDMHSLVFKKTHAIEDFIPDRLSKMKREIVRRVYNTLDHKTNVGSILTLDILNRPVQTFFTTAAVGLTLIPEQVNPLEMIAGQTRTTIMGAGGVSSEFQITNEEKAINPSHLGFLDPIETPEGPKIGATLSIPLGAEKEGTELKTTVFDLKTGKMVKVRPLDVYSNLTVFPDQVKWEKGKPVSLGPRVKAAFQGNMEEISLAKARYVLPNAKALFGISANLIPFIQNNMSGRAVTGSRQQEQALSLVHREAPLIQTSAGKDKSFESILGNYMSHSAPSDGTVTKVTLDNVSIKGHDGKLYEVPLYNNFPLNDGKSFLHSIPSVKKGDAVKSGQTIADNNYTKDGTLALGINMLTAYVPYRGYNFEDGIVISEGAAKRLSSQHMHRVDMTLDANTITGKNIFLAHRRQDLPTEMANKLDADGIVKKGETVRPGDILIAALKKSSSREAIQLSKISRGKISPFRSSAETWTEDYEGVVSEVVKTPAEITIYVKTVEPSQIGDKIVGRHGNKGIITAILPDHEMPHLKDGTPTEILMNPAGVPSRVNLGQLLETAAAKVAKKNGKPILVDNFAPINHLAHVQDLLKKNGLTDKETLLDPKTKRPLGEVLVGPQYIFKLKHQVGTKLQARSRDAYDVNKTPQRGGSYGGQSLGALGIYALLAHGARANLREMATYKSDYNDEVWHAIQSGEQLPPPRAPFTQDKFMTYLKGAGINIYKDGNSLTLMPLTDKHVLELSAGQLTQPSMVVRGKDLFPVTGGLFDLKLTGGPDGTSWSHIKLSEPMPNPIFEGAVRSVLGLNTHQFSGLISGELGITKDGTLDPAGTIHGGAAFEHLLKRLDVDKNLAAAKKALETAPVSRVNEINKKVKILSALKSRDLSPTVYLLHNIPVLPPRFRPLTPRPDGTVNEGDLNSLYKNLATINESLPNTPITERTPVRAALYDAMKALSLHGMSIRGKEHKGILSIIAGSQPKTGFFQDKVIKRRQDLTMRSTIVPEPNLGLDEVGLPEEGAWSLYQPFIQRRLRQLGIPPLRSLDEIKDRTPYARAALEHVMNERPVLLKRDPVLHKFSVMAFKPVLHPGKAIKIHPLVTGGFNADFDGDTMSAFVPVTHEAVEEAKKMYPSGSLFSPTTGLLMNRLSSESLLGTYMMSDWGKQTSHVFKTPADAAKAAADGKIGITEVVQIGTMKTTMGRYMLANSFPEEFKLGDKPVRQSLLSDKNFVFDKKTLEKTLTALARSDKYAFAKTVGKMQNLGTEYVYSTGFSIGLSDLAPVIQLRDKILKGADHKVYAMRQGAGSRADKDKAAIQIYDKATLDMEIEAKKHFGGVKNNIYKMVQSGARGNWDQFKQMTVAPMLVRNAKGEIVPVPIKTSYAEGLDTADYWTALHGGREGIIQKVIGTSKPGAFSKIVMSSTIDMLISGHDCGTQHGTLMESEDPQIIGRYLAQPVKIKNEVIKAGSSVTSELVTRLMNNRVGKVVVRSPLRCDMPHGICQVCFGLNEHGHPPSIGTNIGAIAGQAIGEPATQLALKAFHTGGVVGSKTTRRTDAFTRINQLLAMPKIMPNASVLARTAGPISRMDPDPAGGWSVYVGQEKHYVPSTRELITGLKVGSTVKKGQAISDGDIHPVDLLKLTNINAVQEYLTDELFSAYKPVGPVRRNNLEVVVKAITNLARVDDPGDHPDFARGDMTSASKLVTLNRTVLKGRKPIVFQPVLKPIAQLPLEISEDWMARMNYRHLQDTLIEGAQKGWHTLVHQPHPIPGLAMGTEFGKGTKQEPWLY